MHNIYEEALRAEGALTPALPKVFEATEKVVSEHIEPKMRALMTANELITFAGHLRKNIWWQGASIPVNSIGILIGESGTGKGRSLGAIKKILRPAMDLIEENRVIQAKAHAIETAEAAGKPQTKWRDFYSKPRDLVVAISTLPGWVKHLNGLEDGKLGAGTLYVDELSSELASSKDLVELLTSLSILYDVGHLPVKALKSDEHQLKTVRNLPVSALLFGSPYGLIYNEAVKKKFIDEASSKLARRAIFCFSQDKVQLPSYNTVQEARQADKLEADRILTASEALVPWYTGLVSATNSKPLEVSTEAEDMFSDYKNYNEVLSSRKSMLHPLSKIHRQHRQWAALKIAGALAILENSEEVTKTHYKEAINFVEMFVDDLENFEAELAKESYELASDYIQSIAENGYTNMSIHKLRKMGFVKGNGSTHNKLIELVDLIRSYDDINRYEVAEGYIHFYEEANSDTSDRDELV